MKVIETSNYNLDNYPEKQCSFDGLSKKEAEDIAEELNRPIDCPDSPMWHIVVEDDYVLNDGDPNT